MSSVSPLFICSFHPALPARVFGLLVVSHWLPIYNFPYLSLRDSSEHISLLNSSIPPLCAFGMLLLLKPAPVHMVTLSFSAPVLCACWFVRLCSLFTLSIICTLPLTDHRLHIYPTLPHFLSLPLWLWTTLLLTHLSLVFSIQQLPEWWQVRFCFPYNPMSYFFVIVLHTRGGLPEAVGNFVIDFSGVRKVFLLRETAVWVLACSRIRDCRHDSTSHVCSKRESMHMPLLLCSWASASCHHASCQLPSCHHHAPHSDSHRVLSVGSASAWGKCWSWFLVRSIHFSFIDLSTSIVIIWDNKLSVPLSLLYDRIVISFKRLLIHEGPKNSVHAIELSAFWLGLCWVSVGYNIAMTVSFFWMLILELKGSGSLCCEFPRNPAFLCS